MYGFSDWYGLFEIKWMTRNKQPAEEEDDWAWTYAYDVNGDISPSVGALVDDLRNGNDYIDIPPYRITMQKNKFLHRRKVK